MFAIKVFSCNSCLRATVETRHDVAIGGQSRNLPTGRGKGTNDVPLNFKGLELLFAFPPRFSTTSLYLLANHLDFSGISLVLFSIRYISCISPISGTEQQLPHVHQQQRHTLMQQTKV